MSGRTAVQYLCRDTGVRCIQHIFKMWQIMKIFLIIPQNASHIIEIQSYSKQQSCVGDCMSYKKSDFTKNYYRPGEVAKLLGVTARTITNYADAGKLIVERGETGQRVIQKSELLKYLNSRGLLAKENARRDAVYARVSTHKQAERGDLDRQVTDILAYAALQSPNELLILKEVGSGLNDSRKQLSKLLGMVLSGEIDRIFINYKDRLTRFGFNYIEQVCKYAGTEIVVVSSETQDKSMQEELAEDLCAIIHSFSGKLYGMRGKTKKKLQKQFDALTEGGENGAVSGTCSNKAE